MTESSEGLVDPAITAPLHSSTRFTIFLLSTYLFGAVPALARLIIESVKSGTLVNLWSLPEGYIFAFLLATTTFTESFSLPNKNEAVFDNVRVAAIFLSAVFAMANCLFYALMQVAPPAETPVFSLIQPIFLVVVAVLNLAFMTYKFNATKATEA